MYSLVFLFLGVKDSKGPLLFTFACKKLAAQFTIFFLKRHPFIVLWIPRNPQLQAPLLFAPIQLSLQEAEGLWREMKP